MNPVESSIKVAIDLLPREELVELLEEFGYKSEPTVEVICRAIDEHGAKFSQPLGELMLELAKQPSTAAVFRAKAGLIAKGSGSYTTKPTKTDEQKAKDAEAGLNAFERIATTLFKGVDSISDAWWNFSGGRASSENYRNEVERTKQMEEKNRQLLIGGGIALVVLIIICFMMFALFKQR